jgi:hypothetical protein
MKGGNFRDRAAGALARLTRGSTSTWADARRSASAGWRDSRPGLDLAISRSAALRPAEFERAPSIG